MEIAAMWLEGPRYKLETMTGCGRSRSVPVWRAQPWHTLPREGKDKHWVDRSCENKEMTL